MKRRRRRGQESQTTNDSSHLTSVLNPSKLFGVFLFLQQLLLSSVASEKFEPPRMLFFLTEASVFALLVAFQPFHIVLRLSPFDSFFFEGVQTIFFISVKTGGLDVLRLSSDLLVGVTLTVFRLRPSLRGDSKNGRHQQADRKSKTLTYLCMCFASTEINGLTRS